MSLPAPSLQPDSPIEDNLSAISNQFQRIANESRTKIVKQADTPRVLIGYQSGGFGDDDYGIKVSQPGSDVTTAGDDELVMSSAFNMFKIVDRGTLSLDHTVTGGGVYKSTTASVAHGLSYTPALNAFITLDSDIMSAALSNSQVPNPYPILFAVGGGPTLTLIGQAEVYVDATNVYFTIRTDGLSDGTYNNSARYYLFRETFA